MDCDSHDYQTDHQEQPTTTPILIFTPDPSDTSSNSSPSECSENSRGWARSPSSSAAVPAHGHTTSKDTAYATLYHGYGCTNSTATPRAVSTANFSTNEALSKHLPFVSQIKTGAPGSASCHSTNSNDATAVVANGRQAAKFSTTQERRRHSNSCDNRIPYRQSSLKWKQRNGSATFELKLSQEEFMSRHSPVFAD